MTISFPLSLPATPAPAGVTLTPRASVAESRSPFTFEGQYYVNQGQIWQGEISLPIMQRPEAEAWISALLSLNGKEGTFLMGIAGCDTPRGVATGTPLVNGASQTGRTLITDGWTINITGILKAGDYIQLGTGLNTHLHKNLTDANSNGAGQVTLDIWPRLRVSPADNAPIVVISPKGLWRLASNDMPFSLAPPVKFSMSFPVVEAL